MESSLLQSQLQLPDRSPSHPRYFFLREKKCAKNWHSECRWLISRIMTRQQSLSTQHHRLVWSEKLLHGLGCSESLSATSSSSHRDSLDKNSCDFRSKRNDCRKKNQYGAIIVKLYSSVHQISIKMRRLAENLTTTKTFSQIFGCEWKKLRSKKERRVKKWTHVSFATIIIIILIIGISMHT